MKKLLLAFASTALLLGLGACGNKKSGSNSSKGGSTASETSQNPSEPVSTSSEPANPNMIYCKMEYDWWKADGAAIAIYMWEGVNKPAAWPGQRMTAVSGHPDVWQFEVTPETRAAYPNLIFARVNGSGDIADWGAKTKNLTFPSDGKNLYTITSSEASWGDPGCDGAWSVL